MHNALVTAVFLIGVVLSPVDAQVVMTDIQSTATKGFVTPSISKVLGDLHRLDPIPLALVQREPPEDIPGNRAAIALEFGGLIADGFLNVAAQNKSALEPIGRALLNQAKSLGVGKAYSARAASLANLARKERWAELEKELTATQEQVEVAMKNLRDEDLANLVSLGGWMRGLQIISTISAKYPTPERLALLHRPELADYYIERLETIEPALRRKRIVGRVLSDLKQLRPLLDGPFTPERVTKIREISRHFQAILEQHAGEPEPGGLPRAE